MTEIDIPDGSFDAVVSLYVFNHLSRADLPLLLNRIAAWLRPGGHLLATFGRSGTEGVQDDWLGVPMYFGSYTDEDTLRLLDQAGLEIVREAAVPIVEPGEGEADFLWVLGKNARAVLLAT